jgi:hypothetical protein
MLYLNKLIFLHKINQHFTRKTSHRRMTASVTYDFNTRQIFSAVNAKLASPDFNASSKEEIPFNIPSMDVNTWYIAPHHYQFFQSCLWFVPFICIPLLNFSYYSARI